MDVVDVLEKRCGIPVDTMMPARIREWNAWYCGGDTGFHTAPISNGIASGKRQLARMNMAKQVAEDWANLLLNEGLRVRAEDPRAQEVLVGKDGKGGILGENGFVTAMNRLLERSFALGTGAAVLRVTDCSFDRQGRVLQGGGGHIRFDTLPADCIFPLSWEGEEMTEAAFAAETCVNGTSYLAVQEHRRAGGEYEIKTSLFDEKGNAVPLPPRVPKLLRTGDPRPWFAVFRPNTVNPDSSPMGASVYAQALDLLKGLDLAYDSFLTEFFLGKKMVFLRSDFWIEEKEGNYLPPQEANRQLFMYVGDKAVDGEMIPKEFNPTLRVNDHTKAIQQLLNYLSCRCGLGDRFYRFDGASVPATATEIISSDAALYRNRKKHEHLLEQALTRLFRSVLLLSLRMNGGDYCPETPLRLDFGDSIVEDRASEQKRDLELVKAGVLTKEEFREKYVL